MKIAADVIIGFGILAVILWLAMMLKEPLFQAIAITVSVAVFIFVALPWAVWYSWIR